MDRLHKMPDNAPNLQEKNVQQLRDDLQARYFEAPDLKQVGKNGYRFINAVSDFATHAKPLRETPSYKENLLLRTMEGNPLIYKAYELVWLQPNTLTMMNLLAEAGVGIHEIMERLGHHDGEVTRKVYLHITKTMKKEASQKFGELMRSL